MSDADAAPARRGLGFSSGSLPPYSGAIIGTVLLGAYATLTNEFFFTTRNLLTVLAQVSIVAIMAAGAAMVIIAKGIDLAVAAIGALAGTTAGIVAVDWGWSGRLAIVFAVGIGSLAGLTQGTLISYLGLPPFIVTLGGLSAWRGLANHFTGGIANTGMPRSIEFIGREKIIGDVEFPIILTILVYAVLWTVLNKRRFGVHLYALGGNESAAQNAGLAVQRLKLTAYVAAGALAGIGALIQIGRLDSANGSIMVGLELEIIAAVVIGGISLFDGEGSILGAFYGALFIRVIRNWMNLEGYSSFIQSIVIGAVIVGAVVLDQLRKRAVQT